jgi:hypothetical protein
VIGGLGAAEVVDDLRRVSPGIRVVLSTGYARGEGAAKRQGWDATLDKPYKLDDLRGALESALAAAR